MIAGLENSRHGGKNRCHPRRKGNSILRVLQHTHLLYKFIHIRIHVARINIARLLFRKNRSPLLRILKRKTRGQI